MTEHWYNGRTIVQWQNNPFDFNQRNPFNTLHDISTQSAIVQHNAMDWHWGQSSKEMHIAQSSWTILWNYVQQSVRVLSLVTLVSMTIVSIPAQSIILLQSYRNWGGRNSVRIIGTRREEQWGPIMNKIDRWTTWWTTTNNLEEYPSRWRPKPILLEL